MAKPRVLVIDDAIDEVRHLTVGLRQEIAVEVTHPEELTVTQFNTADLFLIDFALETWPQRDAAGAVARQPMDGLAVAAILRSHFAGKGEPGTPRAFALHSAKIDNISSGLPSERREAVLARALNLEWIFQKGLPFEGIPLEDQIASLANAVKALPSAWPQDDEARLGKVVARFLGLHPKAAWHVRAWDDIAISHPPIHELSEHSHGLAFLRWLLHRILPYPCFLWDEHYLAARLRVTPDSLRTALRTKRFTSVLDPYRYVGHLSSFVGPRYWRAGVEHFLWELTKGQPLHAGLIHNGLRAAGTDRLAPVPLEQPVVCLDANFNSIPGFSEARECVRIHPDDWPPYADDAWATIESASEEPSLKASVIGTDRQRLR